MEPLAIRRQPSAGPDAINERAKPQKEDAARVTEAAQQFESLLLAQMLRSMREADAAGWLGSGEDHAAEPAMALAEEQFAQALATQGGLGLARLIVSGLERARG